MTVCFHIARITNKEINVHNNLQVCELKFLTISQLKKIEKTFSYILTRNMSTCNETDITLQISVYAFCLKLNFKGFTQDKIHDGKTFAGVNEVTDQLCRWYLYSLMYKIYKQFL